MFNWILLIVTIMILGIVFYSRQVVYPRVYSHEKTDSYEKENNTYNREYLEQFKTEEITVDSRYGYVLKGVLYLQENPNKFVIICHGITSNYEGVKKYCGLFLKKGFSVLIYDHRNHGYSDRNYTSMGYYEKYDTQTCINYLYTRYNKPLVGVMGESMGAATVMQLACIDQRVAFCIEDCGYSNGLELFKYRASKDHHKLISFLTYPTHLYLKLFYKWNFKDISVIDYINDATCPMLFIHGESDDYVPYKMVHELYNTYKGDKMLLTVPHAEHAVSIWYDPLGYENTVHKFLEQYVEKRT